jgi:hypothetical protein
MSDVFFVGVGDPWFNQSKHILSEYSDSNQKGRKEKGKKQKKWRDQQHQFENKVNTQIKNDEYFSRNI